MEKEKNQKVEKHDEVKFINDTVLVNMEYVKQSDNIVEINNVSTVDDVLFWF